VKKRSDLSRNGATRLYCTPTDRLWSKGGTVRDFAEAAIPDFNASSLDAHVWFAKHRRRSALARGEPVVYSVAVERVSAQLSLS